MEDKDLTPERVEQLERELAEEDATLSEQHARERQLSRDKVAEEMRRHNRALAASRGVASKKFVA